MRKKVAGIVSVTLGALGGCGDPALPEAVRPQALFSKDTSASDSLKGEGWRKYLSAPQLHAAWAPPARSPWRPYYKPTLVAAVSVVQSAAMPVRADGSNLVELEASAFVASVGLEGAAVFVDLPGEQSVIWASFLQRRGFQPVLTINNWPHQEGVLKLERPLGALLYYADQVARDRAAEGAPPVFILEGSRLASRHLKPQPGQFDNRFFHAATDFPSADLFRSRQITRIYYVNSRGTSAGSEEEDLNAYFLALAGAEIQFTYVKPGQGNFQVALATPARRQTIFTPAETTRYVSTSTPYYRPYYHYHDYYWARSPGAWGDGSSFYSGSGSSRGTRSLSGGSGGSSHHFSGGSS